MYNFIPFLIILMSSTVVAQKGSNEILFERDNLKYVIFDESFMAPEYFSFFSTHMQQTCIKSKVYITLNKIVVKPKHRLWIVRDSLVINISDIQKVYRRSTTIGLVHSSLYIKMKDGIKHKFLTWNRRPIIRAIRKAQQLQQNRE